MGGGDVQPSPSMKAKLTKEIITLGTQVQGLVGKVGGEAGAVEVSAEVISICKLAASRELSLAMAKLYHEVAKLSRI